MRRRKIQALARALLDSQEVTGPPIPVERIVRARGVRIFYRSLEGSISGFLYRDPKRTVIGVNTHHPTVRQRFTLAHELGHFLLHGQEQLHIDRGFQIMLRNNVSSQGIDEEEMEANLFAAELLMPRHFLARDLGNLQSIDITDDAALAKLAHRYGVSIHALMFRLAGLGYLSLRSTVSV